jgi:hypothetical protein
MTAFARQFQALLGYAIANPHLRLSQLGAWLSQREEHHRERVRLAAKDKTRDKFLNLKSQKSTTKARRSR